MRIIVVGGTGTIGSAVVKELSPRHEVLSMGSKECDVASEDSIRSMFQKAGPFDALVMATGNVHFEEFSKMTPAKYQIGLNHKLMGQVNMVLIGREFIKDAGSFTLTSGLLNYDPIRTGSSASMVNGAIEGFVRAAAIELPRNIRINGISPTIVTESLPTYASYFRGYESISAARVALAFSKSVEGHQTGQIYRVGW